MALETPDQTEGDFYRFTWVPHHAQAESFDLERDDTTGLFREVNAPGTLNVRYPEVLLLIPDASKSPINAKALLQLAHRRHLSISRPTLYRCLQLWLDVGVVAQTAPGLYVRPTPQ